MTPCTHRWVARLVPAVLMLLSACTMPRLSPPENNAPSNVNADAVLTPATRITLDLVKLPLPRFQIPVAVYAFRDQTGQFKPQPDSNLSNAVTQGAAAILVKTLLDSGWYLPIEREGFQNLLNERRVARAIEVPADRGRVGSSYPQLIPAQFIFEGGIVGYESNVRTGGQGANLLGIGAEMKYRVDQVTINLRSVDVRTGQVVNSVSVTKTIFSHEISSNVYKFITYKTLLQVEGGYSTNEPSQLAIKEAIETAVIHLTLQGVSGKVWSLKNDEDWYSPLVQSYMRDSEIQLAAPAPRERNAASTIPMRDEALLVRPAQLPLHLLALPTPSATPAAPLQAAQAAAAPVAAAPVAAAPVAAAPVAAAPVAAAPARATVATPASVTAAAAPAPTATPVAAAVPAAALAASPAAAAAPAPVASFVSINSFGERAVAAPATVASATPARLNPSRTVNQTGLPAPVQPVVEPDPPAIVATTNAASGASRTNSSQMRPAPPTIVSIRRPPATPGKSAPATAGTLVLRNEQNQERVTAIPAGEGALLALPAQLQGRAPMIEAPQMAPPQMAPQQDTTLENRDVESLVSELPDS